MSFVGRCEAFAFKDVAEMTCRRAYASISLLSCGRDGSEYRPPQALQTISIRFMPKVLSTCRSMAPLKPLSKAGQPQPDLNFYRDAHAR